MNWIAVIYQFKIEGLSCRKGVAILGIELLMNNKTLALKYKKRLHNL
jgi:hypothetical protein